MQEKRMYFHSYVEAPMLKHNVPIILPYNKLTTGKNHIDKLRNTDSKEEFKKVEFLFFFLERRRWKTLKSKITLCEFFF